MESARPRFVVVYQDRRLALPDGEFVVGRALGCHIRFNAAEVSRQHLRLEVKGGRLLAENLSGTTGTLLNGRRMTAVTALRHGDQLTLGPRALRVEVDDAVADGVRAGQLEDESGEGGDELTMPGSVHDFPPGDLGTAIPFHTCPRCRAVVEFTENVCTGCGFVWSGSHPSAVTGRITLQELGNPLAMMPTEVPLVYSSEALTLDAVVSDLGAARLFLPSPLLDPVGTACDLTLLPDGVQAMNLSGVVMSVRANADANGPGGMEVRFTDVPASVREWLDRWLLARAVNA